MELFFSFIVLLASACVAQILIDKNEINRIKRKGIYDQKGEEAGTQIKKIHQTTVRGNKIIPQKPRQKVVALPLPAKRKATLPGVSPKLLQRL